MYVQISSRCAHESFVYLSAGCEKHSRLTPSSADGDCVHRWFDVLYSVVDSKSLRVIPVFLSVL